MNNVAVIDDDATVTPYAVGVIHDYPGQKAVAGVKYDYGSRDEM
jgi:hypothetical protein